MTAVDAGAFEGCSKLADLSLGSGVTTVGDRAFADCGLTAEARGLADYLAEREDNAAVVNGADFRLDAGNER